MTKKKKKLFGRKYILRATNIISSKYIGAQQKGDVLQNQRKRLESWFQQYVLWICNIYCRNLDQNFLSSTKLVTRKIFNTYNPFFLGQLKHIHKDEGKGSNK